jgi:hypothetical protein
MVYLSVGHHRALKSNLQTKSSEQVKKINLQVSEKGKPRVTGGHKATGPSRQAIGDQD